MTDDEIIVRKLLNEGPPFNKRLGIRFDRLEGEDFHCRMPVGDHLLGDPEAGVLFGGALFALLDYALGAACWLKVMPRKAVATIDLRLDYARTNEPGREILASGCCYRLTRRIAFARGSAYHAEGETPLASAQGTFMVYDLPERALEKQA